MRHDGSSHTIRWRAHHGEQASEHDWRWYLAFFPCPSMVRVLEAVSLSLSPFQPITDHLVHTCICNAAVERVRRVGDRVKGSGKGKNKMRKEVSRVMSHTTQSVCFSFPHGSNTTSTPRSPSCIPPHPQACDSALSVNAARDRSFSRAKKCRQ